LGEENETKLKMPSEIEADKEASGGRATVEAAQMTTTEMAENAGESPTIVSTKKTNINTRNEIILNIIRKKNRNIVSINRQ